MSGLPRGWIDTVLGDIVQPIRKRVDPRSCPEMPYLGLEHVQAHTMRILEVDKASNYRSSAARFSEGDILYGRLRPYLNKVVRPSFDGLCSGEFIVLPQVGNVRADFLGHLLNSSAFVSNGVVVIRMGNITSDGQLLLESVKYLPVLHHEFPALLLQKGDVLFNRTNSAELVGKSAVYQGNPSPCTFASYLIRVRTTDNCLPEFLTASLNSPYGRRWVSSVLTQQVGQANVNGTKLANFAFYLPPLAEQRRLLSAFELTMSQIWNMKNSLANHLARAIRLRQAILAKAFSGQLVPQDPNDEPAGVLLERIRAERQSKATAPAKARRVRSRTTKAALQSK